MPSKKPLLHITTIIVTLAFLIYPPQPVFAETCSTATVVWGNSVGGYVNDCWSGSQSYSQAYTYSKPATSYVTLKAWVHWWETCSGVYGGGGTTGPVTAYNANWVRAKGPWHGYYCGDANTGGHRYYGQGQHTNSNTNEVVYSSYT